MSSHTSGIDSNEMSVEDKPKADSAESQQQISLNLLRPRKVYFRNLDAIRSIACLLVLISHILADFLEKYVPNHWIVDNPATRFVIQNGGLGVQLFFTLSGFLITYLIFCENRDTGHLDLRKFYIRRALRIWPVYFAVVFFVFAVYRIAHALAAPGLALHERPEMAIFFLSNYDLINILSTPGQFANGMLSLTWSVSVEEQFYLFWPIMFCCFSQKHFKLIVQSVIVVAILFSLVNEANKSLIYHHTVSNLLFLGTGGLLAHMVAYQHRYLQYAAKWTRVTWAFIASPFLIVLIFSRANVFEVNGGLVLYFVATASFLFFCLLSQVAETPTMPQLGQYRTLVWMAKYTYGLYMYHRVAGFVITVSMFRVIGLERSFVNDLLAVSLNIVGAFFLAILSYHFIELRFLRLKERYSVLK